MAVLRSFLLRETVPAVLMASAAGLLGLLLTLGLGALVGNFYQHQLEQRFAAVAGERAQDMQVGFHMARSPCRTNASRVPRRRTGCAPTRQNHCESEKTAR